MTAPVKPNRNPNAGCVKKDGRVVVDELCSCGHSRMQHGDNGPVGGHGACEATAPVECICSRFTWFEFITVTARQYAKLTLAAKAEDKQIVSLARQVLELSAKPRAMSLDDIDSFLSRARLLAESVIRRDLK